MLEAIKSWSFCWVIEAIIPPRLFSVDWVLLRLFLGLGSCLERRESLFGASCIVWGSCSLLPLFVWWKSGDEGSPWFTLILLCCLLWWCWPTEDCLLVPYIMGSSFCASTLGGVSCKLKFLLWLAAFYKLKLLCFVALLLFIKPPVPKGTGIPMLMTLRAAEWLFRFIIYFWGEPWLAFSSSLLNSSIMSFASLQMSVREPPIWTFFWGIINGVSVDGYFMIGRGPTGGLPCSREGNFPKVESLERSPLPRLLLLPCIEPWLTYFPRASNIFPSKKTTFSIDCECAIPLMLFFLDPPSAPWAIPVLLPEVLWLALRKWRLPPWF